MIYARKVYKLIMFFEFYLHFDGMRVGLSNHRLWNIGLIQLLCAGEWRRAVFVPGQKKSIQIQFAVSDCDFTFHAGSILISCVCLMLLL